jgi:cystathionine gamma-lyase
MQFRTRAIHVGQEHDPATGAVVPPIHLASTFVQPDASMTSAYDYARTGSPTRHAFEKTLADLDGGVRALAFASGMAATHCVTGLLAPGDRIVTGTDIYGGTWRLFNKLLTAHGILVTAVDTTDTAAVARAVVPGTKLVWIESPGNPLLTVTDIAACATIAHASGALLACDATLATPVHCRPTAIHWFFRPTLRMCDSTSMPCRPSRGWSFGSMPAALRSACPTGNRRATANSARRG